MPGCVHVLMLVVAAVLGLLVVAVIRLLVVAVVNIMLWLFFDLNMPATLPLPLLLLLLLLSKDPLLVLIKVEVVSDNRCSRKQVLGFPGQVSARQEGVVSAL